MKEIVLISALAVGIWGMFVILLDSFAEAGSEIARKIACWMGHHSSDYGACEWCERRNG